MTTRTETWVNIFVNALAAQMTDPRSKEHKIKQAEEIADAAEAVILRPRTTLQCEIPKSWSDWHWKPTQDGGFECLVDSYRLSAFHATDETWTSIAYLGSPRFEDVLLVRTGYPSADTAKAVAMIAASLHQEGRLAAGS